MYNRGLPILLPATMRVANWLGLMLSIINNSSQLQAVRVSDLNAKKNDGLFQLFPQLKEKVPWYPLGNFPTPIEEWPPIHNAARFFVKRDDLTSLLFGGHKIRKLEHLFAEAVLTDAKSLVATGRIGSTQALAIALHGRHLGFKVDLSLFDQPLTEYVKRNLLGVIEAGAEIRHASTFIGCLVNAVSLFVKRRRHGMRPYFIASGANTTLGNIGYVNAGIELAQQMQKAGIPELHRLFIPAGSCGTAAGIIIGLKLAKLRARVVAVQTFKPLVSSDVLIRAYGKLIIDYLRSRDSSLPKIEINSDDLVVVTDYLGEGYGMPTQASREAVTWASPRLKLETTYSGKTLAACLDYCRTRGHGKTILFWNTFNSASFDMATQYDTINPKLQASLDSQIL